MNGVIYIMNGVIYRIYCNDENIKECYIGSTCNFKKRKTGHINKCNDVSNREYNKKIYQFIRENGGFKNFDFEILETLETNDKDILHQKEFQWINKYDCNLNEIKPHLFKSKKEYDAEYNKHNFNERQERQSKKITCEVCGRQFRYDSKWRHLKTDIHKKHM
jgi:hypothetical protein